MSLSIVFIVLGVASFVTGCFMIGHAYIQTGRLRYQKWIFLLFSIALSSLFFNSLFYYQPAGVNTLIQYPSGKQVCYTDPGYHLKFFGDVVEMQKYIPVQIKKQVRFNDSVTADVDVAVRFELSKDSQECLETIVSFRSEEKLKKQTLIPLTEAAIRNSARLLSAQEYVSGNGGKMEQAFQDQLQKGLYILERQRIIVSSEDRKEEVGSKSIETDREKKIRYQINIKTGKDGIPLRTSRSTDKYGIAVSQAEVSSVNPSSAFKDKLKNQMAESARGALERERTKSLQFEKEREEAQGDLDKVKRQLDAEKRQIESLVASEAKEKEAANRYKAVIIQEKVAKKEANIKKLRADAEAYAKKKIMLADGALEKRLDAYVKSVEAMAKALTNKRLVPEIYMGGSGKGVPSATQLIDLMTAKFAKDLGIKDVPKGDSK